MGGRIKGQESQEPRAVKRRAATAAKKAAAKGAPPADPGGLKVSTESIVVDPPAKKKAPAAPAQQYHCANCLGSVTKSDSHCPTCEVRLGWEG
tara:strand:+ start:3172 stop:3450 length:279 start_codon:yes stop_codon:yes gene_type:complete